MRETHTQKALAHVSEGSVVGLGTGHAASLFVEALAERVRLGLRIRGVPTSEETARRAGELGIPLVPLESVDGIDVAVDGADEVDPGLNLIKGYGGALLREKIVASASKRLIILVDPGKLVPQLGSRGRLPVEVIPFGQALCSRRLSEIGVPAKLRQAEDEPFVTDNGNLILDCSTGPIENPAQLDRSIREIPGVVATGLFVGMADLVLVQEESGVRVLEREGPKPRNPS